MRKGLYGDNEFEVRELLEYVFSNSDKSRPDEGSMIKIFDDPVKEETQPVVVSRGVIAR
jgi:hypothetical protein